MASKKDIQQDLNNIRDDIKDMDNVDKVASPQLNDNNHYALISSFLKMVQMHSLQII